jgi:hypothetical protein
MLLGVIVPQAKPDGSVSVRLIDAAKWFTAARVIVELALLPAFTGAGEAAVIVKSRNWKMIVALWISGVLVPVIVAV